MSDGLTEAWRSTRKFNYLESIELKKDQIFDKYIMLSEEMVQMTKNIVTFSKSNKGWFGKPKPDYVMLAKVENEIKVLEIQMKESLKLVQMLDVEYEEAELKPTKYFK